MKWPTSLLLWLCIFTLSVNDQKLVHLSATATSVRGVEWSLLPNLFPRHFREKSETQFKNTRLQTKFSKLDKRSSSLLEVQGSAVSRVPKTTKPICSLTGCAIWAATSNRCLSIIKNTASSGDNNAPPPTAANPVRFFSSCI